MPELPEVETVRNVLLPLVKGKEILKIDVLRSSTIVGNVDTFIDTLTNQTFLDITRIGKFLIFHLTNDVVFLSHLRMEGKYFDYLENEENSKYSRVVFHLNNGHKLCYDDSRCFGMMKLTDESHYLNEKDIKQLGPEPFNIDDSKYLYNKYKKISKPIKSTLLDQTIMTGLGNIYVDEVLFACKIHPLTPANMMSLKDCENIVNESQRILNDAIIAGGSTIRSYHPGKDIDGNFQSKLLAYGQKDNSCPTCGHTMRFKKVGGRGSTYCPICQIKRGSPIKVAIFGKIASGKSLVLSLFEKVGCPTISSDDIVHELYKRNDVALKVNKGLGLSENDYIDYNELRSVVSSDDKKRKKLERIIHPLVRKELELFLNKKENLLVAEVPLLYESKMDDMFDYIIAVDINEKNQKERLMKRNPDSHAQLKDINKRSEFDQNKEKADVIISNNNSLKELEKETEKIIHILEGRLK